MLVPGVWNAQQALIMNIRLWQYQPGLGNNFVLSVRLLFGMLISSTCFWLLKLDLKEKSQAVMYRNYFSPRLTFTLRLMHPLKLYYYFSSELRPVLNTTTRNRFKR
jgi:hypothetical protein